MSNIEWHYGDPDVAVRFPKEQTAVVTWTEYPQQTKQEVFEFNSLDVQGKMTLAVCYNEKMAIKVWKNTSFGEAR